MQRCATVSVPYLDVGLAGEDGSGEIGGRYGGGEHEESLSCWREGRVEEGANLVEEGLCGLRGALVHLHALEPDLDGCTCT